MVISMLAKINSNHVIFVKPKMVIVQNPELNNNNNNDNKKYQEYISLQVANDAYE